MSISLSTMFRDLFTHAAAHDEHLLAGADEEALQALGSSQHVLSGFQPDVAVLCPDLVHEAQRAAARR